jgi:predicted ATPase
MPCHALPCLIGMNNTGKSTILQAVDFVGCIASGNVSQWLYDRKWKIQEITSRFTKRRKITFKLHFALQNINYVWEGTLNLHSLNCDTERIEQIGAEKNIFFKVAKGSYTLPTGKRSIDFNYEGSILASLKEQVLNDELIAIRNFFQSIKTLELLAPLLLRKRARTTEDDIGIGGEKLSAFLYNLPRKKQKVIYQHIHHLFEHFENYHIKAKRSGWKELWIIENVSGVVTDTLFPSLKTEAKHISDGFLRMLAIFSQLQTSYAVLLFDEIEDGLNHEVMEYLLDVMIQSPQQIFVTTHSPMILNFLEDEVTQNVVMLVYKDYNAGGQTNTVRFFDIPKINEKLEYMGPDEIFANVNLKQLP